MKTHRRSSASRSLPVLARGRDGAGPKAVPLKRALAPATADGHDIVVIGASMGGVEALEYIASRLPADFPGTLFVVLHIPPSPTSRLPEILTRVGALPAQHAVHGEKIQRGHIYIAPPDNHLAVVNNRLHVTRGPKENGHRPAVDPLFRSAARAFRNRVVGVVLTGARDCGSAGLLSIKAFGGVAVVQDPAQAMCPDMPRSAIALNAVDHVTPLSDIPALLVHLAQQPPQAHTPVRDIDADEAAVARPAHVVCPACGGDMIETEANGLMRFSCHVGHAYSIEGMLADQARALEAALWTAVRTLQESGDLAQRLAQRSPGDMARAFEEKAAAMRYHGEVIRDMLLHKAMLRPVDASKTTDNSKSGTRPRARTKRPPKNGKRVKR